MKSKQPLLSDTTITCTVCGGMDATPWRVGVDQLLGGTHRYRAVQCIRCGTRRLDPRPNAETMAEYYRPETYVRAETDESEVGKRLDAYANRLAKIAVNSIGNATSDETPSRQRALLDIGCGDGRFMAAMAQRGWQVTGTETDPNAADLARNRTNSPIYASEVPPMGTEPQRFDLISLLHVLEHVSDPRETLNQVRHYLRPGGKLLLVLPNADSFEAGFFRTAWYHLDLPRHLWAFSPASLVRLVETCGYTVDSVRYTPFLFAPQSLLRVFGKVNGAIPGRHAHGTGSAKSGGGWQTRLFRSLLDVSDTVGKTVPGEIIELTATVSSPSPVQTTGTR